MTETTRIFDAADAKLVPFKLPYRSRIALAMALGLDDQRDKDRLEKAWADAVLASFDEIGRVPDPDRIPTLDEALRFIRANPNTTARSLASHMESRELFEGEMGREIPEWAPLAKALFAVEGNTTIKGQEWFDFQSKAELLLALTDRAAT